MKFNFLLYLLIITKISAFQSSKLIKNCSNSSMIYNFQNNQLPKDFYIDQGGSYSITNSTLHLNCKKVGKYGLATTLHNTIELNTPTIVEARLKPPNVRGLISYFLLMAHKPINSNSHSVVDEIDFEFVGDSASSFVQTNIFKENLPLYQVNGGFHSLPITNSFLNYKLNYTSTHIHWYINDKLIRTLTEQNSYNHTLQQFIYPNKPMYLKLGIWDSDAINQLGTTLWAKGPTEWKQHQYSIQIDWIKIHKQC